MKNRIVLSMVIIFITAVIINLTGCSASPSDIRQPSEENTLNDTSNPVQSNEETTLEADNQNTIEVITQDRPKYIATEESIYFFINGLFLGSYDNKGWYSTHNTRYDYQGWRNIVRQENDDSLIFFAKDILDKDAFYIYKSNYKNNEFIGESKQIVWPINQIFYEDVDTQKELAKYGEVYNVEGSYYEPRTFNLPVKLGTEASKIEIPNSQFYTIFKTDKKVDWNRGVDNKLVTNTKSILFPKTVSFDGKPTKEGIEALNILFKNNNMENTISNFTKTIIGDFDNDGKEEYLMIANSPVGENGFPAIIGEGEKDKVGTFSAIIYQNDDGSVHILHQDMRPIEGTVEFINGILEHTDIEHYHYVDLGMIADLNGDGLMEIIINGSLWEMHNQIVYSQNDDRVYEAVLRSYNWTNGPTL
ncbi:UNVERIFIED_CONTAM: hypothetical protein Cloal_3322 [Acetivibrio alkalicellulosi]